MKKIIPTALVSILITALVMVIILRQNKDKATDADKMPAVEMGHPMGDAGAMTQGMPGGQTRIPMIEGLNVTPVPGGITIANLYANRADYTGKKIKVKGQVVKIVRAVMDRNWIHIQDGTSDSGNYDLTITSQAEVNKGDIVIFEGKIAIGKDFGAGYLYPVIMEEGVLLENLPAEK